MKFRIIFATALALFIAAPAAFACDYPRRPDLPIGSKASKDDMLEGQRAVKTYMASMEEYLSCIDKEEKEILASMGDLSEEEKVSREAALNKKYNAAVEEMELLAARFNEQVRSYKEQSQ